ncbi:dihydrolipoamide acetyltransferase family protein [Halalkalibacterium halodurans]|uniref:dihydrolipoamide acetyltransferase family protein n=1 Tax=Halalkalibacterium halodurans TaxID=86665 RepID=UPI002E1AA433|nr:dihydrolipoamide acetyltransferase family protein [Halalkalibacterium halodurans]MED4083540.1 dihydrolipoamide acetyltransferase family protein [Halalkalibacterium halodurans]MED4105853.1 dihydrolipoamide acetyltransferase family protein [Halalkalibacterium halodurans]MED4109965.1 dihydrolipoamide acetyltransferase family protein [Halalkalibacterium halodurans]MED4149306.1 dihydrolipoamide acetyltransferase family protein [Halalkalibacterium halodurans]
MAVEVVMPKLGMSMKEGTISVWNKKEGEMVAKGEAIVSIQSEKIETEIEAPADGTLLKVVVQEDQSVPPGTVIGYIGEPNEQLDQSKSLEKQQADSHAEKATEGAVFDVEKPSSKGATVSSSPVARKMALKAGINLENIVGTGPGGRITKADVEKAIAEQRVEPSEAKRSNSDVTEKGMQDGAKITPASAMRQVIATRMHGSLMQSAQLTMNMKADVTDLMALREEVNHTVQTRYGMKLTVTDFIARAVVLALQEHSNMNSAYIDEHIVTYEYVHLGMAVSLTQGLVVPVVQHAEALSVVELSKQIKSLSEQARTGKLQSDQLTGSTFTVTNLGAYGVDHFTPILNPPEAGILGVGVATDAPVFQGGDWQTRTMLPLSLTFDHRIVDGAPAAEFLQTIKQFLEKPTHLLL